ncbi:RsbRD N-terminal domain-containing protein [Candidatus Zixiibacteriota bacterium]
MSIPPIDYLESISHMIVKDWAEQLSHSNSLYSTRPMPELEATTRECLDAYLSAIKEENYELLNDFIDSIASFRSSMSFSEHEVVDAFRAFRKIASDYLLAGLVSDDVDIDPLSDVIDAICQVVDYTIMRFSEIYYTARANQVQKEA